MQRKKRGRRRGRRSTLRAGLSPVHTGPGWLMLAAGVERAVGRTTSGSDRLVSLPAPHNLRQIV